MNTAKNIILRCGGVAQLARWLGHKHPTTVQYWRDSGRIAAKQQHLVLATARRHGVDIRPNDFFDPAWREIDPNASLD